MNFRDRNNGDELLERSVYCVGNSKTKICYLGGAKKKNLDVRVKQELGEKVGYYPQSKACQEIKPDTLYWTFDIPFKCTLETQETFETLLKDCWEKDSNQKFVVSGIEAKYFNQKTKDKIKQLNNQFSLNELKEKVIEKVIIE